MPGTELALLFVGNDSHRCLRDNKRENVATSKPTRSGSSQRLPRSSEMRHARSHQPCPQPMPETPWKGEVVGGDRRVLLACLSSSKPK